MNKAHILEEIKRTAKANGGIPLGQSRFETETGIKYADWFGKIWARWSEALKEAGFSPNQLQSAFDKVEIFKKFAELTRELGRVPVKGDIRIKKRNDSRFPNEKVFVQFGTKLDLIKELAEYFRNQNGYEDVVRLYGEYLSSDSNKPEIRDNPAEQIGFVYLVKSGRYHKIGRANSAGRREYEIGLQLPEKASTVHVIKTDDPNGIEAYWHSRFASKRKNGEWFNLDASDIAAFKRRKFM
jgi:hypothetical protein